MKQTGEKGTTIVELTITMVQLSIIATVFHTVIGGTIDSWQNLSQRREALLKGQVILDRIADKIKREAVGGANFRLGVSTAGYKSTSSEPCSATTFSYFVSGEEIRFHNTTNPSGFPPGTYFTEENFVSGSSIGVYPFVPASEIRSITFTYYGQTNNPIPVTDSDKLSATEADDVAFVRIDLEMEAGQNPVVLSTAVSLGRDYVTAY